MANRNGVTGGPATPVYVMGGQLSMETDISIGAVELKDAVSTNRATINANGALRTVMGNDKITIVQTPTISAGAIYAVGDAVGGLLTFANASLGAGRTGTVYKVTVIDLDKELASLDLVLFNVTFGATADNAPFDPTDADMANCIGHIPITSGNYSGFADNAEATVPNANFDYTVTGTSLFGQLVARGTPTYTAVGDLTIKLVCQRD